MPWSYYFHKIITGEPRLSLYCPSRGTHDQKGYWFFFASSSSIPTLLSPRWYMCLMCLLHLLHRRVHSADRCSPRSMDDSFHFLLTFLLLRSKKTVATLRFYTMNSLTISSNRESKSCMNCTPCDIQFERGQLSREHYFSFQLTNRVSASFHLGSRLS